MPKQFPFRRSAFRRSPGLLPVGGMLASLLEGKGRHSRQAHLYQLWKNWYMVMGRELAGRAHPLGHREGILLVGAEDQFLLQELVYSVPEILERVNAFMGEDFFRKVELHPLAGRTPLNLIRGRETPPAPLPPCPPGLGGLMGKLDPSLPESRCYEAYVRLFHSLYPHLAAARGKA